MSPPAAAILSGPPNRHISRSALSALDQCRHPHPFPILAKHSTTIVQAALSEGSSLSTTPAQYVLRRLLTGVSVSSGAARLNYSTTLTALTRQLTTGSDARQAANELIAAVKKMYGADGTFNLGYPGADRERALGCLAAVAAVVAGCGRGVWSVGMVREVVGLLRRLVGKEAEKWRLGCAALRVVECIIGMVGADDRDAVVKPMWEWCEERKKKEDGLLMALVLKREGLISSKAFVKLYPSMDEGFSAALLDTFGSGFPIMGEQLFCEEGAEGGTGRYSMPVVWRMSLDYIFSTKGAKHVGDMCKFWSDVVVDKLLKGSRSGEKKLFALEILSLLLDRIHDVGTFNAIFDSSLSSTISVILGNKRKTGAAVVIRKGRTASSVLERLTTAAKDLGKSVLSHVSLDSKARMERPALFRALFLWALRGGILHQLFSHEALSDSLQSISREEAVLIFSETVEEYAQPKNDGSDPAKFENVCNSSRRPDALRFLFFLAGVHSFLAKDMIRVIVLYSIFREVVDNSGKGAKINVVFDVFRSIACDVDYYGVLPKAVPALGSSLPPTGFRRLLDFLMHESRKKDQDDSLTLFSVHMIEEISPSNNSSILVSRNPVPRILTSIQDKGSITLQSAALGVIGQLSAVQNAGQTAPLFQALKTIALFMYVCLFEPALGNEDSTNDVEMIAANHVPFLQKVISCSDAMCDDKGALKDKVAAMDIDDNEEVIEPKEHIAHLISELCGRDASSFRKLALISIEALGPTLDDKIVAVLFDSMDSYLQGDDEVEADKEGDDSGTDGDDVKIDGNESDEEEEETDDDMDKKSAGKENEKKRNVDINGGPSKESQDSEGGSSGSESDDGDAGIDIDEEDPAVLAQLDKVIGTHMNLLKQEKKLVKRRKLKAEFRHVKVSRVLEMIETAARIIRVELEKWNVGDPKVPLVFLDLHVRLYEFALGEDSKNIQFLKQITSLVQKQMLLPSLTYKGKISDVETAVEICDRFFLVLKTCKTDHKSSVAEMKIISRSAGCFLSVVESISGNAYKKYFPTYEDILNRMLQDKTYFWTPEMFNSFVQCAPELSLQLTSSLIHALKSTCLSRNGRTIVSNLLVMLASSGIHSAEKSSAETKRFWEQMKDIMKEECTGEAVTKEWYAHAYANMILLLSNGMKKGFVDSDDEVVSAMKMKVKMFSFPAKRRTRLIKLLNSTKASKPV